MSSAGHRIAAAELFGLWNTVIPRDAYRIRFLELFWEACGSEEACLTAIGIWPEEIRMMRERLF